MKYFHYFPNEENFEDEYYSENYREPWLSVTKKQKKGDVMSFTVKPLGDEITMYYHFMWSENNPCYTSRNEEYTVTNVIYEDGKINAITVDGDLSGYTFYLNSQYIDACVWVYENGKFDWFEVYSRNLNVSVGDTVGSDYIQCGNTYTDYCYFDGRNPVIGQTVTYSYYDESQDSSTQIQTSVLSVQCETKGLYNGVDFNKTEEQKEKEERMKHINEPLTFEIISGGTLYWGYSDLNNESGGVTTIEYKLNDGQWTQVTSSLYSYESHNSEETTSKTTTYVVSGGTVIANVSAGDILQFRGNNEKYGYYNEGWSGFDTAYGNKFVSTDVIFNVKGNIMSLVNSEIYAFISEIESNPDDWNDEGPWFNLCGIFKDTNIVSAKDLILPLYTIDSCFKGLFEYCALLEEAPELSFRCITYDSLCRLFYGCENLHYIKCSIEYAKCRNGLYDCFDFAIPDFYDERNTFVVPSCTVKEWSYYYNEYIDTKWKEYLESTNSSYIGTWKVVTKDGNECQSGESSGLGTDK